jgi:hypothetical protein
LFKFASKYTPRLVTTIPKRDIAALMRKLLKKQFIPKQRFVPEFSWASYTLPAIELKIRDPKVGAKTVHPQIKAKSLAPKISEANVGTIDQNVP